MECVLGQVLLSGQRWLWSVLGYYLVTPKRAQRGIPGKCPKEDSDWPTLVEGKECVGGQGHWVGEGQMLVRYSEKVAYSR